MAQEETPAEVEVPKKKGKLLIIILVLVGVVVLVGGGIAAWLLTTAPDKSKQAHGEEAAAEEHEDEHPPIYEKLEKFTVKLVGQNTYLQTEVQLVMADAKAQEKLKLRMPEVRDAMIRLLSSKTEEELNQPDGMDKLAGEIRHELNSVLGIRKDTEGVKKVLFGDFITQNQ